MAANAPFWSPFYARAAKENPIVAFSPSQPIYDRSGKLLGVIQNLFEVGQIRDFLASIEIGRRGQTFIMERNGNMVASSEIEQPYIVEGKQVSRIKAVDASDPLVSATAQYLYDKFNLLETITEADQLEFDFQGERQFVQVLPINDGRGVDWLSVVVVPESDFMEQIDANRQTTILLCCAALGIATVLGIWTSHWITEPILRLSQASEAIATGQLEQKVEESQVKEIAILAKSFNSMSDQLEASFSELEAKNADLQRLDQFKDEFLANTSHELRTPLNGMIGIAESMLDGVTGDLSEEQYHNLTLLTQSGKRLVNLVNDILDFAKLQHQELHLNLKPVSLREIVEIVLQLARVLVGEKDLQLRNQVPPDLPLINADETRLQQILHNLIGNAIKFTSQGQITITASLLENHSSMVAIAIADTGIGIRADKLDRIFESFEQVEGSASRQYGGTGLGLAITRNLVELHGGQISVTSTLDQGSEFTFTLPVSKQNRATSVLMPEVAGVQGDQVTPLNTTCYQDTIRELNPDTVSDSLKTDSELSVPHILIVDDEPVNLQVLKNFLKLENYTLTLAADGQAALTFLEQGLNPDIILLDVMMPRMTGYEVIQVIRQKSAADRLPIILLSARNQPEDIVLGLEVGANDYLTKPINKDELLARIQTHLQIRQLEEETIRLTVAYEQQLAKFLDAVPVGVSVHNSDGSIFYFNQMAKQILQNDIWQDLDADQLPVIHALLGEEVRTEDIEIQVNETIIPLEVVGIPILDEQGTVEYAIAAFQDITERKRAEQILADYSRELQQEVSQRTAELALINEQLQQEVTERKRAEQNLQFANQQLQQLATRDGLTQVANRYYFDQYLQQEWQRRQRSQQPLSLILFDVDYFKRYNDHYGHQAGDDCLVEIAQAAQRVVQRPTDLVARYGGEEFVVILANTEQQGAIAIAEVIQQAIRDLAIPHHKSDVSKFVSVSLGIASLIPSSQSSPEALISLADQALYGAKEQGRDRYSIGK